MIDQFATIDAVMGIAPQVEQVSAPVITMATTNILTVDTDAEQDRKDDYEFVREKLRSVIEDSADGLADVMELARNAESPRAFEVAANFANTIAAVSKNLMDMHKETAKPAQAAQTINNVNNTVFNGTNADLLKMIKNG